ncbi:MAG: phosphotransferase [Patescibacteria group bacterium]|nr:phosphotransferase [Patescibacteria group bacterium]
MNKILNIFDKNYVKDLFNREILPLYPCFEKIECIKIAPVKKNVWHSTYHVVVEFATTFLSRGGGLVELPIYFTAHSNEPRKNSFAALSFLWQAHFSQGDLVVPRPLFFSDDFNGFFYRGVQGQTLYYYIKNKDYKTIENVVIKSAAWFAKLHGVPATKADNFNPENSRIETVIPGIANVLQKINQAYPRYFDACKKIYEIIDREEKKYFAGRGKQSLIHGDAHPQNVIKIGENKISVIDFTDICLADFARDLGTFLQQLEFMASKKIDDAAYLEKIKNIFLENYLLHSKIKLSDYDRERINNYYNWTALRTATFFMLKDKPEPWRSHDLIINVCENLKIKTKI